MKCSRCEKEFLFEFQNVLQWLKTTDVDDTKQSFPLRNYGNSYCEWICYARQCGFYASDTTPCIK